MTSLDLNAHIRRTQDVLGKVIQKPPLTEKLLSKPPFRFLYDVIISVAKVVPELTKDLLQDYELDSQQINDREKKITFLQKVIDRVKQLDPESKIAVKPSKIVAGQEPEKTNEFLQTLGAVAAKLSNNRKSDPQSGKIDPTRLSKALPNGDIHAANEASSSAGSNKENQQVPSKERASSNDVKKQQAKTSQSPKIEAPKDKAKRDSSIEHQEKIGSSNKRDSSKEATNRSKSRDSKSKQPEAKKQETPKKEAKPSASEEKASRRSSVFDKKSTKTDDKSATKPKKEERATAGPSSLNNETAKASDKSSVRRMSKSINDRRTSIIADEPSSHHSESAVDNKKQQLEKAAILDLGKSGRDEIQYNGTTMAQNEFNLKTKQEKIDHRKVLDRRQSFVKEQRPTMSAVELREEPQRDDDTLLARPGSVYRQTRSARPPSAAGRGSNVVEGAFRPPTANREGAIKRKELTAYYSVGGQRMMMDEANDLSVANRTSSAGGGHVITENATNDQEDDENVDNFIVDGSDPTMLADHQQNGYGQTEAQHPADPESTRNIEESGEHGQLVRKILETKKELEGQQQLTEKSGAAFTLIVTYDPNEKEKSKQQCARVQQLVQNLTRNSLPLSKVADFLKEDVDSMHRELQQWRNEYKTNANLVVGRLASKNADFEALKSRLSDLEAQIVDQLSSISACRGRVSKNDEKIEKLLSNFKN